MQITVRINAGLTAGAVRWPARVRLQVDCLGALCQCGLAQRICRGANEWHDSFWYGVSLDDVAMQCVPQLAPHESAVAEATDRIDTGN